jgi:hypothetical protein
MKSLLTCLSSLIFLLLLNACGLERDIDLRLPKYEKKLVVECYLERNQPIRLLLTESQDFLDNSLQIPDVKDAQVIIKNNETIIPLSYNPTFDTVFNKFYNYTSNFVIPANPNGAYELEIIDTKGRRVTGSTRFLEILPISEVTWEFEDKDKEVKLDTARAFLLSRHPVSPSGDNYRLIINRKEGEVYRNQVDFVYRGITATNGEISIGTSFRFKNNDTVQVLLYHIERQFYTYIRSVEDARDAAGNPFAQPSPILSSVNGGLGIFTTAQFDERNLIIKR